MDSGGGGAQTEQVGQHDIASELIVPPAEHDQGPPTAETAVGSGGGGAQTEQGREAMTRGAAQPGLRDEGVGEVA